MSEKAHSLSPPAGSQESVVTDFRYVVRDVSSEERGDLERKALRRMDYTLLPFLTVLFLLAFLVSEHSDSFYFDVKLNMYSSPSRIEPVAVNLQPQLTESTFI